MRSKSKRRVSKRRSRRISKNRKRTVSKSRISKKVSNRRSMKRVSKSKRSRRRSMKIVSKSKRSRRRSMKRVSKSKRSNEKSKKIQRGGAKLGVDYIPHAFQPTTDWDEGGFVFVPITEPGIEAVRGHYDDVFVRARGQDGPDDNEIHKWTLDLITKEMTDDEFSLRYIPFEIAGLLREFYDVLTHAAQKWQDATAPTGMTIGFNGKSQSIDAAAAMEEAQTYENLFLKGQKLYFGEDEGAQDAMSRVRSAIEDQVAECAEVARVAEQYHRSLQHAERTEKEKYRKEMLVAHKKIEAINELNAQHVENLRVEGEKEVAIKMQLQEQLVEAQQNNAQMREEGNKLLFDSSSLHTAELQELATKNELYAQLEGAWVDLDIKNKEVEQELATKNEELATKNEELATKNEELATKNEELATKNEEYGRLIEGDDSTSPEHAKTWELKAPPALLTEGVAGRQLNEILAFLEGGRGRGVGAHEEKKMRLMTLWSRLLEEVEGDTKFLCEIATSGCCYRDESDEEEI